MKFLNDLKIRWKLAIVVGVMAVPVLLLVYLFVQSENQASDTAELELEGLNYLSPLRDILQLLNNHGTEASALLSGDEGRRDELLSLQPRVEAAVTRTDAVDQQYGSLFGTRSQWNDWKQNWRGMKETLMQLSAEESLERHNELTAELTNLMRTVSDNSRLTHDPGQDTFYLVNTLVVAIPQTAETLGRLMSVGERAATRRAKTQDERVEMTLLIGQVSRNQEDIRRSMQVAFQENREVESRLAAKAAQTLSAVDQFAQQTTNRIVLPDVVSVAPRGYHRDGETALEALFSLYDDTDQELRTLLDERLGNLASERYARLGLAVLVLMLAVVLVSFVSQMITGQISSINKLFSQIGMGNFEARAEVMSNDELGEMTKSLNSMLDNTLALIQSTEERDRIQANIQKLLDEISGVAEGDLSQEAEVTPEVTGAIADSFNFMIGELRAIISAVQQTTLQVSSAANEIQTTAEHLADGSEQQSGQIVDTSAAIEEMAVSIQQVSSNAASASEVAENALRDAQGGTQAVAKTISGMSGIRQQVQETSKRIKRLGESSQEIGEIVQLISEIADRTSILALNASIQAAMAGEAGRGFGVVAEEVERLAERATDSTKRIEALIKSIQSDTGEAIAAMEATTKEVVTGSSLATEAGTKLEKIEGVSSQLAELIQSISMAANQQARGSDSVAKAMGDISGVTQQTAAGAKQAAISIRNLAVLADELRESVGRFRLPNQTNGASAGRSIAAAHTAGRRS